MNEVINVTKKPGIKDCVRILSQSDIPENLKDVIKIEGDTLVLDCLEGEEKAPIGSVIAFEKLEDGKMNVWNKANWKETTREVDGVFYEISKINTAVSVTESVPSSIVDGLGDRLTRLEDGSYQITTDWGLATCKPNDGYFIIYGKKEDGSLDANFLAKGTPSYEQYYVCDENGNIIQSLKEHDNHMSLDESFQNKR